jgi:hypothetical protein
MPAKRRPDASTHSVCAHLYSGRSSRDLDKAIMVGLDGLLIFDGRRLRLDGTSQGLLGGPWRPLTVAQRLTLQHQLARAEIPLGPPHRSSRQPVMAALISLPTPQVTAPITIDQALVRCFPVAATRWLSSHRSAGNLEPNHRDRRCLRRSPRR